jgi:putative tricarboxylic transport membrane protein
MSKHMTREVGVALVVIAVAAWYYWQATFLPTRSVDPLGPAAYPKMLAVVVILFGLLHIIVSYFRRNRLGGDEDALQGRAKLMGNIRIASVVAATAVYLLVMEPLGYIISTFAYIMALPALVGERSVRGIAISAVLVSVLMFVLFVVVLKVLVPEGIIGQMLEQ